MLKRVYTREKNNMNHELLRKKIQEYKSDLEQNPGKHSQEWQERNEICLFYQDHTANKLLKIDEEGLMEYLSPLWSMLIWGNKRYIVDKIIEDNGLDNLRAYLADLVWGDGDIVDRWDSFRLRIKGIGPATMSEILCKTHPDRYFLWNRRALVGLYYLGVKVPRYDYQLKGNTYKRLCQVGQQIAEEMRKAGLENTSLLAVDYFIWDQLQVAPTLSQIRIGQQEKDQGLVVQEEDSREAEFIHNDIRDKLRDIGQWLGFIAYTERKVAQGAQVDTVWEATIGNMGRVIYVFEVQTSGYIDSLLINLLKSLNNPAVQGVVAVSNKKQLERIKSHAMEVKDMRDKLKYWDYENVLQVHESLQFVNESINELGLVPESF